MNTKPYGFCCSPNLDDPESRYRRSVPTKTSLPSIHSLHECPALRIREQLILKRRRGRDDVSWDPHSGSAVKLDLHNEKGGTRLGDATESQISLMIDEARARRQKKYEENMDRWALLGEARVKARQQYFIDCGRPHWYADFSISQLKDLKELEDSLFKDKEEKTTTRTLNSLERIGMISDEVKVKPKVIRKLLIEYSTDLVKFLCEIYKAITGNYFQNEEYRENFQCTERIILSAVAFLELPKIIEKLHKRLPPIMKFELPIKPKRQKMFLPKKRASPYLQDMALPANWRLYETEYIKWRQKYVEVPRPLAILPKKEIKKDDDAKDIDKNVDQDKQKKDGMRANDKRKKGDKKDGDTIDGENQDSNIRKISLRKNSTVDDEIIPDKELFPEKDDWTSPPTECPYKYRKILNELGPLKTDEDFFSELKPKETTKEFPTGREHLSLNVQHILLNAEADFFKLTEEADRITGEVEKIAQEIFNPPAQCNACCACKQTKKSTLEWHVTKTPHTVIDGVVIDKDEHPQVIGMMAMHSPAESISTVSGPPCIPSDDKLAKSLVIDGTVTMVDGKPVKQVGGVSKYIQHQSEECLGPEVEIVEIRNVPPCACGGHHNNPEDTEIIKKLQKEKDKNLCYGKKFRPKAGPAYSCKDFVKKGGEFDDCCACLSCSEESEECEAEWCDEFTDYSSFADCYEGCYEEPIPQMEEDTREVCEACGMRMDAKCPFQYPIRAQGKKDKDNKDKKPIPKCSCNSLTEFLQMDLSWMKCFKPQVEFYKREMKNENEDDDATAKDQCKNKQNGSVAGSKCSGKSSKSTIKSKKDTKKSKKEGKKSRTRMKLKGACVEEKSLAEDAKSEEEEQDEGGPYGYRTKSEEALPVIRTIAYLTELHPPDAEANRIPVREGGRPCRCRENRNKRKTLMYGIGGLISNLETGKGSKQKEPDNSNRLIESVAWVTPEPSIRGSDEYIPEYELYDSPYEKGVCCGGKKKPIDRPKVLKDGEKEEKEPEEETKGDKGPPPPPKEGDEDPGPTDRTKDWDRATQDPYLRELFTRKRDKVPCWNKCSKFRKNSEDEPRKLKVMKPVCECKYERRIVKRKEERMQWLERQRRLRCLKKESFLHIEDITRPVNPDPRFIVSGVREVQNPETMEMESKFMVSGVAENYRMDPPMTMISAITVQTPCSTPLQSLTKIPIENCKPISPLLVTEEFDPCRPTENQDEITTDKIETKVKDSPPKEDASQQKSTGKKKSEKSENSTKTKISSEKNKKSGEVKRETGGGRGNSASNKGINGQIVIHNVKEVDNENSKTPVCQVPVNPKHRKKFFAGIQEDLTKKMNAELEKMKDGEFVSLSLPDYFRMPQLEYWITYRAFGMNYTKQEKVELMFNSIAVWKQQTRKLDRRCSTESITITKKDRPKLNFDRALYWKRKIGKLKTKYYKDLREDIVTLGRCMFRTMEFGKFPNVLFKQAYFTYMPPREKDTYILGAFGST